MSLYNLMHGENANADALLEMLNLTKADTGRFRDIFLNGDGTVIRLLTRNGGGNREEYQGVMDALAANANYVRDYDDEYDRTYAYVEFNVPTAYRGVCASLADGRKDTTLKEKTDAVIHEMKSMTEEQMESDPRFSHFVKVMKAIGESSGTVTVFDSDAPIKGDITV